jgi:hypothetical protein
LVRPLRNTSLCEIETPRIPILPEVRVLEVPAKPGKVVTVVKIHESSEAPHAIQNSTRVYIRTGNISSPYDLAEIDRIEYLLKRRERPQKLREELIAKSDIRFREHVTEQFRLEPYITVEVARLFPREPILPPDAAYGFATLQRSVEPMVEYFIDRAKGIPNGVFSTGFKNSLPYAELSTYGLVLTRSQLHLSPSQWTPNTGKLFVRPAQIIWTIGRSLKFAAKFFQWAKFSGNLKVIVEFVNVLHLPLQYSEHENEDLNYVCSDQHFSVDDFTITEDLGNNLALNW